MSLWSYENCGRDEVAERSPFGYLLAGVQAACRLMRVYAPRGLEEALRVVHHAGQ
jgi:hypothetical protein